MSDKSGIQWTQATWNPVSGCTRVSAGCDHCYAVKQSYRLEMMGQGKKYGGLTVVNDAGDRHFNGVVRCDEKALTIPLKWKTPRTIFVNSMSDLFHKGVPFEFIDKVFAVMALCPQHTFQVLTKRPERMAEHLNNERYQLATLGALAGFVGRGGEFQGKGLTTYLNDTENLFPLRNVWLGTSCENQQTADERIPHLLKCPAAVRFISAEPLLGPIDLTGKLLGGFSGTLKNHGEPLPIYEGEMIPKVDWVIVGGESGHHARPCDLDWVRSIVRQCADAGTACFVKQLGTKPFDVDRRNHATDRRVVPLELNDRKGGDLSEWPSDLRIRQMPSREAVRT